MKKAWIALSLVLIFSCKEQKAPSGSQQGSAPVPEKATSQNFPDALQKVFEAHGSLEQWKRQKTLVFRMPEKGYPEIHTVDLYNRKDRIDTPEFSMGFDGKEVWLQDSTAVYEGDPVFYHNLMFYFYAMPFVLADDGIVYTETEALVFEGKAYPGIGIGYEAGVGTTPKDEYFMHYDPDSYQMAWLGYTVTYRTGERSENIKWIRYDDWAKVNGLLLPKTISWYNYEGREIKDLRNTVLFDEIQLQETSRADSFYARPDGAKIMERKTN